MASTTPHFFVRVGTLPVQPSLPIQGSRQLPEKAMKSEFAFKLAGESKWHPPGVNFHQAERAGSFVCRSLTLA